MDSQDASYASPSELDEVLSSEPSRGPGGALDIPGVGPAYLSPLGGSAIPGWQGPGTFVPDMPLLPPRSGTDLIETVVPPPRGAGGP